MIEKEVREIFICDVCSSKVGVRSYRFEFIERNGNIYDIVTKNIKLCHKCQEKGYKALKGIIP